MSVRTGVAPVLSAALPVMLGYVTIGIPCGVMEAEVGLSPLMAFLLSASFYSGAGQFMMSSLALVGTPVLSMVASVSLVSTRQLLYSAALSPYLAGASRPLAALFAATVTDESFGVNLERFSADDSWSATKATAVNLMSMFSWALANALGAIVGPALAIPTAVMSFAMTSIFICLLACREWARRTVVCAAASALGVIALKVLGLGSIAVLLGALAGVVAGILLGPRAREGAEHDHE